MTTRRRRKRKIANYTKGEDPGFKPVSLVARTPNQKEYIKAITDNTLTFVTGPAGTGKTHVAIGMAVQMLRSRFLGRIVVTRPLVSVGRDVGYLPGGIEDKVGPYVQPCFDELNYYLSTSVIGSWQQEGFIEIVPLSMMRGRTFNNAFVILDEAQNATRTEIKTLLTRIGEPSRLVLAGDVEQTDLPFNDTGAFQEAIRRLSGMGSFKHIELGLEDIIRNPLIRDIIERLW